MKFIFFYLLILNFFISSNALGKSFTKETKSVIRYIENKGQIVNQDYFPRADILFYGQANGLVFHLRNNGISYQLNNQLKVKKKPNALTSKFEINNKIDHIESQTIYRIDINWINSNNNSYIKKEEGYDGYINYYTEGCPIGGATYVKAYKGVTYENLYNDIDLKWYEKNGSLKYDYLCKAGSDYKQIKLEIKGSQNIFINRKGELVIKTPLGLIIENKPIVKQNNYILKSKWKIQNNVVSFEIENLNKNLPYIIDPLVRVWGTYYGGIGDEIGKSCVTDSLGNSFLTGYTQTVTSGIIATTGSYQTTYNGGYYDAFITKFDINGTRIWGTYYGGNSEDRANSSCVDRSGNVYITGETSSSNSTVIATPGAHQESHGGGVNYDVFLAKFNNNGVRIWSTYYGGNGNDESYSCTTDIYNNVYITGRTTTSTGTIIATNNSHQTSIGLSSDAFLIKFNNDGVRQWGTYYGGSGIDWGFSCRADNSGNIFMSGYTTSTESINISSNNSHQISNGGGQDAFLVKFNTNGSRIWGTFYGGSGDDISQSCHVDNYGNIYLAGYTNSSETSVISTNNSHQNTFSGGAFDAFLIKFNNNGIRLWGTYYGGNGIDYGMSCVTDTDNNVILSGYTSSNNSNSISTSGSFQSSYGGNEDVFVVKFNENGVRQWGSYYGGSGLDYNFGSCIDSMNNIFISGVTNSNTSIANVNSHQNSISGSSYDAFLIKLWDCTPLNPSNVTPANNLSICAGSNSTLSAISSTNTIIWYTSQTGTITLHSGSILITPTLNVGEHTFYAEADGCTKSPSRTAITITVNPLPFITVNSGTICNNSSFVISPNGADTYTIQGGNTVVTPSTNSTYTVIGASINNCISSNTATSSVIVNPKPDVFIYSNNSSICIGSTAMLTASGAINYEWNTNQNTSSIVINPNSTSSYSVIGTNQYNCKDTAYYTQIVEPCTNIEDILINEDLPKIYPNPFITNLFVDYISLKENISIIIINSIGQKLFSMKITKNKNIIDLSDLPSGIYLLQILNNYNVSSSYKLIKQ